MSLSFLRIFNTNNLWINLPAVKRLLAAKQMKKEIIVNNKVGHVKEKLGQSYLKETTDMLLYLCLYHYVGGWYILSLLAQITRYHELYSVEC